MDNERVLVLEERLKIEAAKKAAEAYGTQQIFAKRAFRYRRLNKIRDVLGIGVPAMIGVIIVSFSLSEEYKKIILICAGIFAVTQLFLSVLSIVYGWDDRYSYARESVADNNRIRNRLETILLGFTSVEKRHALIEEIYRDIEAREKEDLLQELSDTEYRYGERQGLDRLETYFKATPYSELSSAPTS